jgi:hypothetical protein
VGLNPLLQPDDFVQRLLEDPYVAAVLRDARAATSESPDAYASLLEKAASVVPDDTTAGHLLLLAADAYEALAQHYVDECGQPEAAIPVLRKALSLARRAARHTASASPSKEDSVPPIDEGRSRIVRAVESVFIPQLDEPWVTHEDEQPTNPQATSFPPTSNRGLTDPSPFRPSERVPITSLRPPPAPPSTPPAVGDRLMGLFEALHAVRFCREVREGAALVVQIVRDAFEAESVAVHLYDESTREYVVAAAQGTHHRTLVGIRTPEGDPLLSRAVHSTAAVVASPIGQHALFTGERWTIVDPKRSVVCAPVLYSDGPLGAIEMTDPKTRDEFDAHDCDAMTYVGERVAEFLSERGLPLD